MKILFIISKSGYQEVEFEVPRQILEDAGYRVDVASISKGNCISGSKLHHFEVNKSIDEIEPNDYLCIVFVGGGGAYKDFIGNKKYYEIARKSKILGAICIAPTIISYSGVLKGKKVTGWDSNGEQIKEIEKNGGIFTGNNVETDGNIVTANGPQAAEEFGKKLLQLISHAL